MARILLAGTLAVLDHILSTAKEPLLAPDGKPSPTEADALEIAKQEPLAVARTLVTVSDLLTESQRERDAMASHIQAIESQAQGYRKAIEDQAQTIANQARHIADLENSIRPADPVAIQDGVYGKVRLEAGEDGLVAMFDTDTGRHIGTFPVKG